MAGDAVRFDPAPDHWIRDAVRLNAAAIGMNRRLGFAGYDPRTG
jgi:hypothetical protein